MLLRAGLKSNHNYQSSKAALCWRSFGFEITVLPWATLLAFQLSNGNIIVTCNFARFTANDVEDLQAATGNEASFLWQQHKLNVKTWSANFRRALFNW